MHPKARAGVCGDTIRLTPTTAVVIAPSMRCGGCRAATGHGDRHLRLGAGAGSPAADGAFGVAPAVCQNRGFAVADMQCLKNSPAMPADTFHVHGKITSNFTQESYASAFAEVPNHLQAGDCDQINLAQRFGAGVPGDALFASSRCAACVPRLIPPASICRMPRFCVPPRNVSDAWQGGNQTDQGYLSTQRRCAAG